MLTLAIETSTTAGSLALLEDGVVLFSESFPAERTLGGELFRVMEAATKIRPSVDLVAVGLGPGSYAGVRIAISAALGFSLAAGGRLVGLPSVVALGEGAYFAIGDARRGAFYFSEIKDGVCVRGPVLMTLEELREILSAPVSGSTDSEGFSASPPARRIISAAPIPDLPGTEIRFPSAERLARLAEAGVSISAWDDLEPIYLREPHITLPKGAVAAL